MGGSRGAGRGLFSIGKTLSTLDYVFHDPFLLQGSS
jgi:hypothetical protein